MNTKYEVPFYSAETHKTTTSDEFHIGMNLRFKWLNKMNIQWGWRAPDPKSAYMYIIIFNSEADALAYTLKFL